MYRCFINLNNTTFLQFEVYSSIRNAHKYEPKSHEKTLRKLGVGLAEQLRALQVRCFICYRILFPTGRFEKPIKEVT